MAKTYDISVLGATAAGYVAAIILAKAGRQVVLLDAPAARTESPLADWVPGDLLTACPALKPIKADVFDAPFKNVCFHSAQLDRESCYSSRAVAGYLLRSAVLLKALDAQARKAGVERVALKSWPRLELGESSVAVHDQRGIHASILLVAQDNAPEVVARLALPVRTIPRTWMTVCGLDAPLPPGAGRKSSGDLHVVSFGKSERLGMFFHVGGVAHVRMISSALICAPPR